MIVGSTLALKFNGQIFQTFTGARITRDMREMAGGFALEVVDQARAAQSGQVIQSALLAPTIVNEGFACTVAIDGETVLTGYVDDIEDDQDGQALRGHFAGRDRTGDLVDCAALPNGPAEFRGLDLLAVAKQVCAPFNIAVRAEADIGAPFENLAINPCETALAFLEGAARQRAILLVSDGVGGLLLTTGGATRAPAPIQMGANAFAVRRHTSWRRRFSDVFVKGHTDAGLRRTGRAPALDHTAAPLTTDPTPADPEAASTDEATTVLMTGHAQDPEITRWRPTVRQTRSQSGMSSTQEQAEWAVRVARGEGISLVYSVLGWRAGDNFDLWRPNQLVAVYDPYRGIDQDMLIAGVTYTIGARGQITQLRVVGRTAFDRINEAERRRHHHGGRRHAAPALDSTATPLTAD